MCECVSVSNGVFKASSNYFDIRHSRLRFSRVSWILAYECRIRSRFLETFDELRAGEFARKYKDAET